jgi:hypothetical protein
MNQKRRRLLKCSVAGPEAAMDDISDARHRVLVKELQKAALNLLGYSKAHGTRIPIEGTTPPVYVMVGDADSLVRMCRIAGEAIAD